MRLPFLGRPAEMAKDPVCGTEVNPGKTEWLSAYNGSLYYFCSMRCLENFDTNPGSFTHAETPAAERRVA